MTQPGHTPRRRVTRGPKQRDDSTRPASSTSRTRRGGDRRPYPTASTTTRVSPAKPSPARDRKRPDATMATPTPATVWTAGPAPIDLDATWPTPIVEKIVGAFSEPGGRVTLMPWPTARPASSGRAWRAPTFSDGVLDHAPGTEPDGDVADALTAIEGLRRTARVVRAPIDEIAGRGSRPFWADLVGTPDESPATVIPPSRSDLAHGAFDGREAAPADTDLVVTSLRPEDGGDHASDLVALLAARLLRVGGILAVITHCDWTAGELIDPTGAVVAAAQNADLLYLQHIIALHAPVRDGRFAVSSLAELDGPAAAEEQARTAHRAAVRGLPAPHRRVHSDVLVFAQPHQHEPPPVSPREQARETGVIR
jgi:hypothetical protein